MQNMFENLNIPEYDLEAFMKSITYQPEGMSMSLARQLMNEDEKEFSAPMREALILRKALEIIPIGVNSDDIIAGNYGKNFADEDYLKRAKEADEKEFDLSIEYKCRSEDEKIASGRYMLFGIYTPSHTTVNYPLILEKGLKYYEKKIQDRLKKTEKYEYAYTYLNAMQESIETVCRPD